jgi:hypothetical protein
LSIGTSIAMVVTMRHDNLVRRLSAASVRKHFDAYTDVEWDHPDHRIAFDDPRWVMSADNEPLAATAWYQSLPAHMQSRLGLHFTVAQMSLGITFERVLTMGLLNYCDTLPLDAPALRYAYHEAIEESQHSLMFREFVNRTGLAPTELHWIERWSSRRVATLGRRFPELFFMFVLAGEAPIDQTQRQALTLGPDRMHPLLRKIIQIHVLEEARHLSFAASSLRERVPQLSWLRMLQLQVRTPIILKLMTEQMLQPPGMLVRAYDIPRSVVQEAYGSAQHHQNVLGGQTPVRELCRELGVVTDKTVGLWRALGIWPHDAAAPALPACL